MKFMVRQYPYSIFAVLLVPAVTILFCLISQQAFSESASNKTGITEKTEEGKDKGPLPKAFFPQTSFNVGEVYQGDKIVHTFIVENHGEGILKILSVKPGCGCTVATYDKIIKPGQKGKIKATISTDKFKSLTTKKITVTTNDPENDFVRLQLGGTVKVIVDVYPQNSVYFFARLGVPEKKVLAVTCLDKTTDFQILKIENTVKDVKVTQEPFTMKRWEELKPDSEKKNSKLNMRNPGNTDYILTLTLSDEAKAGQQNGVITLFTNIDKKPEVRIEVMGRVEGPLKIQPSYFLLGKAPLILDTPMVKQFKLHHTTGEKFTIKSITCKEPHFTFEFSKNPDGTYKIIVTYNGGFPEGRQGGDIIIHTDSKDQPEVILKYSGAVVGKDSKPPMFPLE